MFTCPTCGAAASPEDLVCRCGTDLALLWTLERLPDVWFNRALEALPAGRAGEALEWFAACCAARPSDAAARRALAKVWAQLGHVGEAERALEQSARIDPDHADLVAIRQALVERGPERADCPPPSNGPSVRTEPAQDIPLQPPY